MKNKKFLILVILAIFCMGVTIASVSAVDDSNSTDDLGVVDESDSRDSLSAVEDAGSVENLSKNEDMNSDDNLSSSQSSSSEVISMDIQSQNNFLSSSASGYGSSSGHTYHINGYTFAVSANQYAKIKKAIKMGKKHDWLDDGFAFKVKTNKFYTYKKPIYKTKKVIKYKWKYKKISVSQSEYWDWEYKYYSGKKTKGWTCYKLMETDFEYGVPYTHYVYLKKKVKCKTTKKVKTGQYKNVKMRVYAYVKYQGWSEYDDGPHYYYPFVNFKAIKKGYSIKYLGGSLLM